MPDDRSNGLNRHLPSRAFVILFLAAVAGLIAAFVYTGVYNIGADAAHSGLIYRSLEEVRERAIAHHSRNIPVPADLNDSKRVTKGAGLYAEMCSGCHLGPGVEKTELSQGLYPPAPELARGDDHNPAQQFWIIKHGIKLSAMPAWGKTHSDQLIWDMVAFVRQLSKMTPQQYRALVASAPADHEQIMEGMKHVRGDEAEAVPHTHRD